MSKPNDSGFPHVVNLAMDPRVEQGGLTKRDLFAAMAMQGILACPMSKDSLEALNRLEQKHGPEEVLRVAAESARRYADALLAELAKERA